MGQQSKSEGAVLRFAKYYTPLVVSTCVLLIVVPAIMRKQDLKVHSRSAAWPASEQTTLQKVHYVSL